MSTNRSILDLPQGQRRRIPVLWWISAAAMLILVIMMLLHTRSRDGISPIEILFGTQPAPARDGIVVSQDGVTVYMPANATQLDGTLSISVAAPGLSLVANDTEWSLLKVVQIEFRDPNGRTLSDITFAAPLEICFHLTQEQWQAYTAAPDTYRVQQFIEQTSPAGWQVLPQVTHPDQLQLCGQATRLSLFGLAVHAPPVLPVTGGLVPAQAREEEIFNASAPVQARQDDDDVDAGAPVVIPTNPPPTQIPPTQAPVVRPRPTDPPPAEEPVVEPPAPNPGNGNGNGNEGPGNGNGNGGGGNGNGNEGPGNGNDNGGGGNGNGNEGPGNGNDNGGGGNGNGNGGGGNGNGGGGNGGKGRGDNE